MNLTSSREKLIIFILMMIQFNHILDFVVLMPLGPILMRELSINAAQFSFLVSVYTFAAGIMGLIIGPFIDNFKRKILLIICFIGFILGTIFCALSKNYELFIIARSISGAFGGVLTSIIFTIISDLIPTIRRGKAIGSVMSAFSISSIIGVPTGLFIANQFGWKMTFWAIVFTSVIFLVLSFFIIPNYESNQKELENNTNQTQKILKKYILVLKHKDHFYSFIQIFFLAISAFLLIPYISPFLVFNLKVSEQDLQYVYLFGGVLTILTSRFFGGLSDKLGPLKVFFTVSILSFIPILLLTNATTTNLTIILIITTFFMSLLSGRFVPAMSMSTMIPSEVYRGTFLSLINSIRSFGSAIASFLAGLIIILNEEKIILNYHSLGFLSILFTIFALFFGFKANQIILNNKLNEPA